GQNQPRRDDFGLKIGKLSHRTSIKDGLGRHIGSCGPLNRNFLGINSRALKITIFARQLRKVSPKLYNLALPALL
ncbi:hypothetical protein, partial [Escherichia coli]|uniref:hypothetical protein n=1 Tax=Escherichia coli TaxID=562 RepID=UPI001BDCF2C3